MATFKSDKAQASSARRVLHSGLTIEHAQYTGSASLSAGDTIEMVKVGAGGRVHSFVLSVNTLGTSATPTVALGDGLDSNRYFGTAAPTAGFVTDLNNHAGHGYEYTADDTVDIRVASVPSGNGTSAPVFKLTLGVFYDN